MTERETYINTARERLASLYEKPGNPWTLMAEGIRLGKAQTAIVAAMADLMDDAAALARKKALEEAWNAAADAKGWPEALQAIRALIAAEPERAEPHDWRKQHTAEALSEMSPAVHRAMDRFHERLAEVEAAPDPEEWRKVPVDAGMLKDIIGASSSRDWNEDAWKILAAIERAAKAKIATSQGRK